MSELGCFCGLRMAGRMILKQMTAARIKRVRRIAMLGAMMKASSILKALGRLEPKTVVASAASVKQTVQPLTKVTNCFSNTVMSADIYFRVYKLHTAIKYNIKYCN